MAMMPSNFKPHASTAVQTYHAKRERRIEEMMLSGIRSNNQIASAFGMHINAIQKLVKGIKEKWKEEGKATSEENRTLRIRQIENIAQMALKGYRRSMVDSQETIYKEEDCQVCNATGKVKSPTDKQRMIICTRCEGEGHREIEIVKVKGNAPGDPQFLKLAKDCYLECSKLEGNPVTKSVMGGRRVVETASAIGGDLEQHVHEVYFEGPTDVIIEAMKAFEVFQEGVASGKLKRLPRNDDGDVIDVGMPNDPEGG